MKPLMKDQCITQCGSERGGGQVWHHRGKTNKQTNMTAVWELGECGGGGTERGARRHYVLSLGIVGRRAGHKVHTHPPPQMHEGEKCATACDKMQTLICTL